MFRLKVCVAPKNDIAKARQTLGKINNPQKRRAFAISLRDFLNPDSIERTKDWLEWADQYRNMFVHRGRPHYFAELAQREVVLFDANEQLNPAMEVKLHRAKYMTSRMPKRLSNGYISERGRGDYSTGMFRSTRELLEAVCERGFYRGVTRRNEPPNRTARYSVECN